MKTVVLAEFDPANHRIVNWEQRMEINPFEPPLDSSGDNPEDASSNPEQNPLPDPVVAYTANGNLEAHSAVTWLESNGVRSYAVEDNSGASLFAFGTTQNCPKCGAYMDAGIFDWPEDYGTVEDEPKSQLVEDVWTMQSMPQHYSIKKATGTKQSAFIGESLSAGLNTKSMPKTVSQKSKPKSKGRSNQTIADWSGKMSVTNPRLAMRSAERLGAIRYANMVQLNGRHLRGI